MAALRWNWQRLSSDLAIVIVFRQYLTLSGRSELDARCMQSCFIVFLHANFQDSLLHTLVALMLQR
jgi:hypothetical protein